LFAPATLPRQQFTIIFIVARTGMAAPIADDCPVLATGEDGLVVTRILTAVTESAKSWHPVDLYRFVG
jgi:hypothetical protein